MDYTGVATCHARIVPTDASVHYRKHLSMSHSVIDWITVKWSIKMYSSNFFEFSTKRAFKTFYWLTVLSFARFGTAGT